MTPGQKLRLARESHRPKITREDVAEIQGRSNYNRIASYELGRAEPPKELIAKLAARWDIPLSWWYDGKDTAAPEPPEDASKPPDTIRVPYWGTVPCGDWEAPQGDAEEIEVPAKLKKLVPNLIAVRVTGESMSPLFVPGDVVPVKKTAKPRDGVVTLLQNQDKDLTLKIARYTGRWEFHSLNPKHGQAKAEQVTIIGVAVFVPERLEPEGIRV